MSRTAWVEHVDDESAKEGLAGRMGLPEEAGLSDFLQSRQGKAPQREVLRGAFGMLRERL